jgi:hypothetical protein
MIKRRPSEKLDIVLVNDPALACEGASAIVKYSKDRNINKLDIDVGGGFMRKTGEKVTILTVLPLASDKAMLKEMGASGYLAIIKNHVIGKKNADFIHINMVDGNTEVSEQSLNELDDDVAAEIATVIIQLGAGADGVDKAFFLPDIFSQQRTASRSLPARIARIENVKDTPSQQSSEGEAAPSD